MSKNAIIIHGAMPEGWQNREPIAPPNLDPQVAGLQSRLLSDGCTEVQAPFMPSPESITYSDWVRVLERHPINEDTTLVGIREAAGFLIKYLSQSPRTRVSGLHLLEPKLDEERVHGEALQGYLRPKLLDRIGNISVISTITGPHRTLPATQETLKQILPRHTRFLDLEVARIISS